MELIIKAKDVRYTGRDISYRFGEGAVIPARVKRLGYIYKKL